MQSVRQILHKYVFAKPENQYRSHIMRFDDKSNRLIGRGVPDDALDPCL